MMPTKFTFPGKHFAGQYHTLDGKKTITQPRYSRYVMAIVNLTYEEQLYVLQNYVEMERRIEAASSLLIGGVK